MEFKDKHFEDARQVHYTVLWKELCKKNEGFESEQPTKTVNDADQNDLEKSKQCVKEEEKQVKTAY